uniref:Uncharacterized protein n=1 Tax=Rhizophora mucronata TaxID=61149 RepID=A0A2P2P1Y5_RHIMU
MLDDRAKKLFCANIIANCHDLIHKLPGIV